MALPAHSCGAGRGRGGGQRVRVETLGLFVTGMWVWHVSVSMWELFARASGCCCEGDCVFVFHVFA